MELRQLWHCGVQCCGPRAPHRDAVLSKCPSLTKANQVPSSALCTTNSFQRWYDIAIVAVFCRSGWKCCSVAMCAVVDCRRPLRSSRT